MHVPIPLSLNSYNWRVRHTAAMGAVDFAGNYVYDKASLELRHQLAANQTIGLGYQFYNFDNQSKGSGTFDDYIAHGMFATCEYTF